MELNVLFDRRSNNLCRPQKGFERWWYWNNLELFHYVIISFEIMVYRVRTKQQGKLCKFVD